MSVKYTRYLTSDFVTNNAVAVGKFKTEIEESSIVAAVESIIRVGDVVDTWFASTLSGGDETTFDGLVAAHDGVASTSIQFHAASKLVEGDLAITEDASWQCLGGAVTTPDFFSSNIAAMIGRITGRYKTDGSTVELRMVEDGTTALGTTTLPDTASAWATMQWMASTAPSAGTHEYTLEGRLNGSTSASVKFCSVSLLEVV